MSLTTLGRNTLTISTTKKVTKIQKEKEEAEQKDKENRRLLYERLKEEFEN